MLAKQGPGCVCLNLELVKFLTTWLDEASDQQFIIPPGSTIESNVNRSGWILNETNININITSHHITHQISSNLPILKQLIFHWMGCSSFAIGCCWSWRRKNVYSVIFIWIFETSKWLEVCFILYIPGPSSLDAKWFGYRMSIHHPLGINWHP